MRGIALAAMGCTVNDDWRRVTLGDGGGARVGFRDLGSPSMGSINLATYRAEQIREIAIFLASPNSLFVHMGNPNIAQNYFNSIGLRRDDGGWSYFASASAIYTANVGGSTEWLWTGIADNSIWALASVGQVRAVKVFE